MKTVNNNNKHHRGRKKRLGNRGIVRGKEKQQTRAELKGINTKQSHNHTRREKGKTKDNIQLSRGELKTRWIEEENTNTMKADIVRDNTVQPEHVNSKDKHISWRHASLHWPGGCRVCPGRAAWPGAGPGSESRPCRCMLSRCCCCWSCCICRSCCWKTSCWAASCCCCCCYRERTWKRGVRRGDRGGWERKLQANYQQRGGHHEALFVICASE